MNLKKMFNNFLTNAKESLMRFPITLVLSTLLVVFLIILNEGNIEDYNFMIKISMLTGLAIPISIFLRLADEVYIRGTILRISLYIIGGGFLLLYYLFFLNELKSMDYARYIGILMFFIIGCTFIQRISYKENYEKYIISILNSGLITGIYSIVLYLGIAFIIFTLEQLFEINMIGSIYYYVFLVVVFIFGVSMFLSKYPDEDFKDFIYPKSLKVLLLYIIIPLVSLYTFILYAYFLKIIVTSQWPSGLVSHLVIWYSTASIFVIFFIIPLLKENQLAYRFKKYFPIISIPILIMMFLSIGQRIFQYGFTGNRYYVLLLGVWLVFIMIYFITKKINSSVFIMISLSAFVLISVFGPLSSFSISIRSQNKRLNELLYNNNILDNGVLSPNENVSQGDQERINDILLYFYNNYGLDYVDSLPDGYDINSLQENFGFPYDPYQVPFKYFNYYDQSNIALDISNYDFYIEINSWENKTIKIGDNLQIYFDNSKSRLSISSQDKSLIVDIKDLVWEMHNRLDGRTAYGLEDLSFVIEESYNIKIIFTNISGYEASSASGINLEGIEFILLLDYSN